MKNDEPYEIISGFIDNNISGDAISRGWRCYY